MKRLLSGLFYFFLLGTIWAQQLSDPEMQSLAEAAERSLARGIAFYQTLAIEGGYVYYYSLDGEERWGEGKTDARTIEVQPPGTPAVGMSFIRAYRATSNPGFLAAAEAAAAALIKGQNEMGGWDHKIYFDRPLSTTVSFDDDQTQSAISFLMALDQEVDRPELTAVVEKALDMMLNTQLDNGGWPHQYPARGNYHDYATFNDHGINDCIRVMLEAHRYYGKAAYAESIAKVTRFLNIAQLPPPQAGWAQQYNEYLQPAWARTFEPPSVCPAVTINNLHSLMDIYEHTGNRQLLEPIPDAIRWLKDSQLPNGKWARFIELGTNKALYYDRGRIRVDSLEQLSLERRSGYAYEVDLSGALARAEARYQVLIQGGETSPGETAAENDMEELVARVQQIIQVQDEEGRWVARQNRFRRDLPVAEWNGEYRVEDRISSALFNYNVSVLCMFLERYRKQ
ncbi:MAG: pectate lyase [Saprospiraceae bacterium]|nr:hypothetical protein [Lewinella sp.]